MTLKKILPLVLALALLVSLFFMLNNKTQAPEVRFITLDGKTKTTASLKGKLVLVDFWATSCPGCIEEMPKFATLYRQYHDKGFELIAVAMPYDPPDQVMQYRQKAALPFDVMHDTTGEVSEKFGGVSLTPTAFIINQKGEIIRKIIGAIDFNDLQQQLDRTLK